MPTSGPADAPPPPPFRALDALHATPEGRWETLKLSRLLKWLWRGTTGWPPSAPTQAARAYVAGLTTPGPSVMPAALVIPGIRLNPYQVRYADLLLPGNPPPAVRLSRAAEMLHVTHRPILGYGATDVFHIDNDWFSDSPTAPHPFIWTNQPVVRAETREKSFVDNLITALELSLGIASAPAGNPAGWPPDSWPPLVGNPPPGPDALLAQIDTVRLAVDKPIEHYWNCVDVSVFRFQQLIGHDRILFIVTTPQMP